MSAATTAAVDMAKSTTAIATEQTENRKIRRFEDAAVIENGVNQINRLSIDDMMVIFDKNYTGPCKISTHHDQYS